MHHLCSIESMFEAILNVAGSLIACGLFHGMLLKRFALAQLEGLHLSWRFRQYYRIPGLSHVNDCWLVYRRHTLTLGFCRVEPPDSAPRRPSRTLERNQDRWNPHLSTVPSEGTGSHSEGRSSRTTWLPESSRASKSSITNRNARESSDQPQLPSLLPARESSDLPPLPHPQAVLQRIGTGSTIRVVNEPEDDLPTPLAPIPGSRGSEYLGVASGDNRCSVVTKRGSKASFFRDSIPAWAK